MSDALQPDDRQLLRRFAADRSEAAFGELVTRHVTLVYSAALRQTGGDAHRAQDIAQLVFTDLARKAPALAENVVLAGWLHRATIFAARQTLRGERRRRAREQEAVTMNAIQSEMTNDEWGKIRPLLDEALERLHPTDRDALLLRFFEQQSLAQIGTRLGSNEDAARKRVQRALEKLRAILTKRGVTTTVAALSAVITANAMPAAPAGLALTLTHLSFAAAGTGTLTLLKMITTTKVALAFIALVIAGAVIALMIQHQAQNKLREEIAALHRQIVQLQADNADLSNRLADAGDAKKLTGEQFNELLKLRGEVGVLRWQFNELRATQSVNVPMLSLRTNSPVLQVHIKARFIAIPIGTPLTFKGAGFESDNNGSSYGIFNNNDFQKTLQELQSFDGVETLGEPEVVTTSGRQTQMRVMQVINVVTNYTVQETNNVPGLAPQTEAIETGSILDVVPRVLPDGYNLELQTISSVTDFLGYAPPVNTTPAYDADGQEIDVPTVLPQFRIQQATNTVNSLDNQTAFFQLKDGQIPADATFLEADGSKSKNRNTTTYVFITATIVDPAGNRVHNDADTESFTNASPPSANN